MDRSYLGTASVAPSRLRRLATALAALLFLVPLLATFAPSAGAQDEDADEVVIFVLDLSGSMNEPFNADQTKLDVAKAAFIEAFANVSPDARVGLRTYGDQIEPVGPADREESCTSDTRLASPIAPLQRDDLIAQVQGFTALGDTPVGLAIQEASLDIPAGSTGTIVLFSDGRDECFDADLDGDPTNGPSFGDDPCEIAKAVTAGDSSVDRVVTVGFRADAAAETELRCIAESTGGSYTAIETPEDARDALPRLLVQLSAPREAQRLLGRQIQGATTADAAPLLVRLDEVGAESVLYTDSIDMNSNRIYRMLDFGPDGGTFTATVFGLPPEADIAFDMRISVPALNERFFEGEHGDFDAGLPERPTSSIRCTDCQITGGPHDVLFIIELRSEGVPLEGSYELEILTEGPGFGGPPTSCSAPQECFYPQEILDLTDELEAVRSTISTDIGELAPDELIAERDQLRIETAEGQRRIQAANARAQELEERIALAPEASSSFRTPLLMMLAGAALAFAPVQKLRRRKDDDAEAGEEHAAEDQAGDGAEQPAKKRKRRKASKDDPADSEPAEPTDPASARPSLDDVGPPPAISPNLPSQGNSWDADLEAAKVAIAQQRPERPATDTPAPPPIAMPQPTALPAESLQPDPVADAPMPVEPPPLPPAPAVPVDAGTSGFTEDQHAQAKAAAEKIIAQRAAEQAAAEQAAAQQAAAQQAAAEQAAAQQAAARQAAAEQAAAEQAAAEQAAAERAAAAQQAAAEQAARQAAAEQAAAQQAAAQQAAAERAAAEQAAAQQAAAQQAAAERAAAVQAANELAAAERAAAEAAAQRAVAQEAMARAEKRAAEEAAAQAAVTQASAAIPPSAPTSAMTEEERRQEARQRMLAKQNIVASSSNTPSSPTAEPAAAPTPPVATPSQPAAAGRAPEAPGWYEDPAIMGQFRWWDGSTWTGHTAATNQGPAPA